MILCVIYEYGYNLNIPAFIIFKNMKRILHSVFSKVFTVQVIENENVKRTLKIKIFYTYINMTH